MSRIALPQVPDPLLSRAFATIQQAINDLDDRIPNGVLVEKRDLALSDYQFSDKAIVVARSSGIKVVLPAANNLGTGIGEILFVLNQSTGTITVLPASGNTVNGAASVSLTTGQGAIIVGDGDSSMKAWIA